MREERGLVYELGEMLETDAHLDFETTLLRFPAAILMLS